MRFNRRDPRAEHASSASIVVSITVFHTNVVLFRRFTWFPRSDRPVKPTRYDRTMDSTISQKGRYENPNRPGRRQNYSITKKEKHTMQNEQSPQRRHPTTTIGGAGLVTRYREGVVRLTRKEEPDHEIACIDAETLTRMPFLMTLIYQCIEKDATLSEETRHRAGQMARSMLYATQIRIPPRFGRETVAKKAAELFDPDQAIDETDIMISREDLKSLLAHCWEYAEEDLLFTPLEDRAGHIFPVMAHLFELIAGPNEELRQFVDDCLSEETYIQIA
jgi:hypothetical protein